MNRIIRTEFPRLPLDGSLDLTYRCNNFCRHCWLWTPNDSIKCQEELSYEELKCIIDEARSMGCQAWSISGGEPMLRPDFPDIFDYITNKSVYYKLNTNGTLINPGIAKLLTRRGRKMVALYGATAEVHDMVTRNPGSYEATMRGFAYLKEAGADFIVQIVPMRENYHQYKEMLTLAETLSPVSRIGAPWLWFSECHSSARNREIASQRLAPIDVVTLDEPDPLAGWSSTKRFNNSKQEIRPVGLGKSENRLFASCIKKRRDFHIDAYGQMSFCYYIKDPALRYDLRKGSFKQAWEEFIPSLADVVVGDQEYQDNCGSCDLKPDCRWCAVFGYLEHGRYSAKVEYLCQVAEENRRNNEGWRLNHLRYYQIAGITLQVAADFPMQDKTFLPIYNLFRVDGPGDDNVIIRHNSYMPEPAEIQLGNEIYHRPPWVIYQHKNSYIYKGISSEEDVHNPFLWAIFDSDYNRGNIYRKATYYQQGNIHSLTTFVTDQLLIARLLADRQGCYLHSSGIIINGQGLLFIGHSEAGKSTMLKMLRGHGEILCDDRMIIRRWPDGFKIHGTWSHGELPDVSPASAPLKAIFYLEKSDINEAIPITDKQERLGKVLSHVVKPFITADWWEKTLPVAGKIAAEVPAFNLKFNKNGQVVEVLEGLLNCDSG